MADRMHPLTPEFDNRDIETTDLRFHGVTTVINSNGHSDMQSKGRQINTAARDGDKMEECLGVNGWQLFV